MDEVDRDLFAGRLNDLNKELDAELTRHSKLQLELRDNQAELVSYELVHFLIGKFDALLHLIVKKITLDGRKLVDSVELAFNVETEKRFLSIAPSAEPIAEGAFHLLGKSPSLRHALSFFT